MINKLHATPFTISVGESLLWITRVPSTQSWSVEAYARCTGGIMYLQESYVGKMIPPPEKILVDALMSGAFSPRPVRLHRHIDPSMSHCVLALLSRFCLSRRIDLHELLADAHPGDPPTRLSVALSILQGLCEGIVLPLEWSKAETDALVDAMIQIGWDVLADTLERRLFIK